MERIFRKRILLAIIPLAAFWGVDFWFEIVGLGIAARDLIHWFIIGLFVIAARALAWGQTGWERRVYAAAAFSLLLCVIAQGPLIFEEIRVSLMSDAERGEFIERNGMPIEALFWVQILFTAPVVIVSTLLGIVPDIGPRRRADAS